MLVLKRKEGDWTDVTHAATGQVLRFRVYNIIADRAGGRYNRVNVAFDDPERNFEIRRPEAPYVKGMTPLQVKA